MISEELKSIIDTLEKHVHQSESDKDFFPPATEEQISEFEKNNQIGKE